MSDEAVDRDTEGKSSGLNERSDDPLSNEFPPHRVIEPSVLYVGTPAYLVATQNPDGTANLAPASSHFALGRIIVLGLEEGGQSLDNARRHGELTVNFPSADQWQHVERLAGVTGKDPVPAEKPGYEFEPHKFERAGLTPTPSDLVDVPRVAEAPIQLEARVLRITDGAHSDGAAHIYGIVEAEVVRVHAAESITVPGTDHLDPEAWHPLIYAYRHFFDRGPEVGWTRKSPVAQVPAAVDRWELNGGTWRVHSVTDDQAIVELRRCDGGEIAELATLTDPHELRWARVQLAASANPTALKLS
ncbi:flavin reductase family protein [Leucobacter sp. HY1910]